LEEPEASVILILTVPDPGLLLSTILSRVQLLQTQLLTTSQIKNALVERWNAESEEADIIASLAAGRMGWAVQAIEDDEMLSERSSQLDVLKKLPMLSRVERFDLAQRFSVDGDKARDLLELWLLWWRDMVLAANNCLDLIVNIDMRETLQKQASQLGSAKAVEMVRSILQTIESIEQNVNVRVALEVLMLDVPTLK